MVQAQIESIQGKGDWQGKFGTMYTFEIAFADGTVGEANSKTAEPPYKVAMRSTMRSRGRTSTGRS